MCEHSEQPNVELVLPGEGEGPLTPILRHFDEMIYHICYEINDLDTVFDQFDTLNIRAVPISPPKPAILFGGRKVSFYKLPGFGVIELLES